MAGMADLLKLESLQLVTPSLTVASLSCPVALIFVYLTLDWSVTVSLCHKVSQLVQFLFLNFFSHVHLSWKPERTVSFIRN